VIPASGTTLRLALHGAAGFAALGLLATGEPRAASFAFLTAFLFWTSVVTGALSLLLVGHVTGARWFVALRRPVESVAATAPLLALLFAPIAFALPWLYPATDPTWLAQHAHELTRGKQIWLAPPALLARSALWLGSWVLLAAWLRGHRSPARTRRTASALLPLFALSVVFAAFDWILALTPLWSSAIFGVAFLTHAFRTGVAVTVVLAWAWIRRGRWPASIGAEHLSALGRLLLTAVILVAYMEYSQGLLVWIADLPHEVPWLAARAENGWGVVLVAIIVGELGVPLFALLPRWTKRRAGALAIVAAWLIAFEVLHIFWLVRPEIQNTPQLSILDLCAFGGTALLFLAAYELAKRGLPALPVEDPRLAASLRYASP
jgi:hypothetical protein